MKNINKKIGIVGLGVVGTACKEGFEKIGYDVLSHDLKLKTKIDDLIECDTIFICVPTNSNEDGSCDISIVQSVLQELHNIQYNKIIAIKSTVVPGTTNDAIKKYNNNKICFVPEFLRERCATTDFVENHDILAIGTNDNSVFEKIKKIHGNIPKNVIMMDPVEAELIKYYSNVYNALRIIFANEMFELCQFYNADYNQVKDAFLKIKSLKYLYYDCNQNLRGFGGQCLPKDVKALANVCQNNNLNLGLFDFIIRENQKFKTTAFKGMRQ